MRKVAFLVANDTFPKDPSIPPLRYTQNDARELAKVLEDRETCGFETRVYLNRPSQEVLTDLDQVSGEVGPDDTLLFYYSGHGKLRGNELCLVSNETTTTSLGATSIRTRLVLEYLQGSLARRRILILDCCHSGAIGRVYKAVDSKSTLDGLADSFGSYILTASTSIELAEEREKDGYGVFTKALIDCLREGPKDRITINDLYEYAHARLKIFAQQTPLFWALQQEGTAVEIGNYEARRERERQLERERLETERQQEREQLISTARTRLGAYLTLGELTEGQVEEAVALLKRDEARLFPRERKYRDDLIRFSKGEASFLEVFGLGHSLRPEPAPKPPEDEISPAITPPEAPAVDAPLTLSEAPAIDQPSTPPEPAVVDQVVTTPEPAAVERPVLLSEPPAVDQPFTPPEQQAPLQHEATAGGAESKPRAQEPRPISATGVVVGIGMALAVILLGSYFYLDSPQKAELAQREASSTLNLPSASPPLTMAIPSALTATQEKEMAAKPGSEFTDCASCPAMIVVPAGKFLMGSPKNELRRDADEGPQRQVRIAKPFAVSKYEVTFAEWDACAAAGTCPRALDEWERGQMPVINVSWNDAKQYVGWLSKMTGKEYRLLTEAEWEYAARAGTTTAFYWGDDVGKNNANCFGCGSQWDGKQTAPVGSFQPNAFGLYDMAGNVWEWVEDVWHDTYKGAPTDGSAWMQGGDATRRAVRGGSWFNVPQYLRAADRDWLTTILRGSFLGFRVGRMLSP